VGGQQSMPPAHCIGQKKKRIPTQKPQRQYFSKIFRYFSAQQHFKQRFDEKFFHFFV